MLYIICDGCLRWTQQSCVKTNRCQTIHEINLKSETSHKLIKHKTDDSQSNSKTNPVCVSELRNAEAQILEPMLLAIDIR